MEKLYCLKRKEMKIKPDSLGNLIHEITIINTLELRLDQVCENSP